MAFAVLSQLRNLWPFSIVKNGSDLKISDGLVCRLLIPDETRQFVFAVPDPKTNAVVYFLAVQNLSEQSASDAEHLIKAVKPDAVVGEISPAALSQIQEGEFDLSNEEVPVPTSSFGVLKRCFINKTDRNHFENMAGNQVLRDIFGVGFCGHFLSAKGAAKEVNSTFLCVESPSVSTAFINGEKGSEEDVHERNNINTCLLQQSNLLPGKATLSSSNAKMHLCLTDEVRSQMVKLISASLALPISKDSNGRSSDSVQGLEPEECQLSCHYQVPPYAKSVYALLTDLHDIFVDFPAIGKALVYAQQILINVDRGDPVDADILSEVQHFRIAVEGLRITLNNVARSPDRKMESSRSNNAHFSDLSQEEKSHALLAHAIKSQMKKFKSIVVIVDASCLAGLRKYWNTSLPQETAELAEQCFTCLEDNGEASSDSPERLRLLASKPVVAVGAGASALVGASSLSKIVPLSTFMKLITYKVPTILKTGFMQALRTPFGATKFFAQSKILAHSFATSGFKASALKAAVSTEKIRVVTHGVIASAERTSLQVMRATFYEIMRRRRVRPVGFTPWVAFGSSVAICAGLITCGDGIECAVEAAPAAPRIACLGRGLRSLQQASQEVRLISGAKIQDSIKSIMYSLQKIKFQ